VLDNPQQSPAGEGELQVQGRSGPIPTSKPPRRDYAYATERELADLRQQRDRLVAKCDELVRANQSLYESLYQRITVLEAENARLTATTGALADTLEVERMDRGVAGIIGTVLAAVGGGLVSVWSESFVRAFFAAVLFTGCLFMFYNSLRNLSADIRTVGIRGWLGRLWHGRSKP
jgi:hypothetical protein